MTSTHSFSVQTPGRVIFGSGSIGQLAGAIAGDRALVVASRSLSLDIGKLAASAAAIHEIRRSGEPTIDEIERLLIDVRSFDPSVVVGIGGGSTLDTAKALSAYAPNQKAEPIDYLEIVGRALALENDPIPTIAVPTTAGTGSEATKNAVLAVPNAARKVSLRDPRMVPRAAIIDPDLGNEVPYSAVCASAFDAAVQLVEAYATPMGNRFASMYAHTGAEIGLPALARLVGGSNDPSTRSDMALAAFYSGVALANAKLGTIHGFAGAIGGAAAVGHGLLCGLFAGPVLSATVEKLNADNPDHPSLTRYGRLATMAVGRPEPEALGPWFSSLARAAELDARPLLDLDVETTVAATLTASSTAGNPVALTEDELASVLAQAVV